jgi:hypothetical protein
VSEFADGTTSTRDALLARLRALTREDVDTLYLTMMETSAQDAKRKIVELI